MRILAVDTATPSCSVALVEADALTAEMTLCRRQTHARHLMTLIETVLRAGGVDLNAVDGFAVSRGPGSFTGLRIGMSTIKGLAAAADKPLVGVSSLEALARQAPWGPERICAMIDARRAEIYYARYQRRAGSLRRLDRERVGPARTLLEDLQEDHLFIGNGAQAYRAEIVATLGARAAFPTPEAHVLRASTVARCALERFIARRADDPARLAPQYIRRSDAERHRDADAGSAAPDDGSGD